MKQIVIATIFGVALFFHTCPAWAAEDTPKTARELFVNLLPLLIILGLFLLTMRWVIRVSNSNAKRLRVHMDRVEGQNQEMVALLKEIRDANNQEK